ncbi:MAG: 30S ribosomal protein S16 [Rickettsiales bacterium]|jgi:small subunit ribosomal protein S16|nr:30S ribosomal protein S16 [Rickettsiales bacterium]
MSVKIRLSRKGSKSKPFHHIVVANSRAARDGSFIEKVGTYDPMLPREDKRRVTLVAERIKYWLSQGAKPSDKVARFLAEAGITGKYAAKTNAQQPKASAPKAKAQERLKAVEEKKKAAEDAKKQAAVAEAKAFEEASEPKAAAPVEAAPAETPVDEVAPAAEEPAAGTAQS